MRLFTTAIATSALMAVSAVIPAQTAADTAAPTVRFGGSMGLNLWQELGDLQPFLGGDFEETGIAVELNLHGGGWTVGPARIYAGADLGIFGNGSDVRGIEEGEDLQASMLYLTPSLKAVFRGSDRFSWTLDGGIGYYDVAIDEWEDDCFWSCDIYEYYDDSAVGGYLGLGVEWLLGGADGRVRLTGNAKVHFVEFDEPIGLAPNGSLDGPIYMLSVGLGIYR